MFYSTILFHYKTFQIDVSKRVIPGYPDAEKKARSVAVQTGYRHTINIPLHIAAACVETARIGVEVSRAFNANTAGNLTVALKCAQAGLRGGLLKADVNPPSAKDAIYVRDVTRKVAKLEKSMAGCRTRIEKHLKGIPNA